MIAPWGPQLHEGRAYGLSGMVVEAEEIWMTWSYEDEGHSQESVAGLLMLSRMDPKGGAWGKPQLCEALEGKPEGIALWRDQLIIVFDQDRDRKGGPEGFPLRPDQDFALTRPRRCSPNLAPSWFGP